MKSSKINNLIDILKFKNNLRNKNIFFFFPYYHIGGAERVHIDILKVFKNQKTVCIITNSSLNNYFYEEFNSNSKLIEIEKFKKKIGRAHV